MADHDGPGAIKDLTGANDQDQPELAPQTSPLSHQVLTFYHNQLIAIQPLVKALAQKSYDDFDLLMNQFGMNSIFLATTIQQLATINITQNI